MALVVTLKGRGVVTCNVWPVDSIPSSYDDILNNGRQGEQMIGNEYYLLLNDLIPSTNYSVYCLTAAFDGTMIDLQSAIRTGYVPITTACCKLITVKLASAYLVNNIPQVNFITAFTEFNPGNTNSYDLSTIILLKIFFPAFFNY